MTLLGEDDSRDPQGPQPYVRKFLLIIYNYIFFASSWFPDIMVPHHCQPILSINERIAQGAADSWDPAARAVFVFLGVSGVFLERCFCRCSEEQGINWAGCGPSSPSYYFMLTKYPAQILIFQGENGQPSYTFFAEYPTQVNLLCSAPLGCKSFLGGMHQA